MKANVRTCRIYEGFFMLQMERTENEVWTELIHMNWSFDDRFDRCFLLPEEVEKQRDNVSYLRKIKGATAHERSIMNEMIKLGRTRYFEFIEKMRNQPRVDAQKFIGKRNVREFIFKRDNYSCLRCGSNICLSIDHILPVSKNGMNRIYNLQTLCRSCNSWKSNKFIDFRI